MSILGKFNIRGGQHFRLQHFSPTLRGGGGLSKQREFEWGLSVLLLYENRGMKKVYEI
jgi:hypothetical protein